MKDRAGFFAGMSDTLTDMCAYYLVAGILIMSGRGWGLHLFWLLFPAAVCAGAFPFILKKPRSVPFLALVTGIMFVAVMGCFWLASSTPMKLGYGFVLSVGAGMAVGLSLNYALHRPLIHKHLMRLDILIIVLAAVLLTREALGIDGQTVALMVAVLLMDAAAAVGLRMSDGGAEDGKNAFKASMVALAGAAGLALVIGFLTMLFSRSGGVTGSLLQGIGSFFSAIGRRLGRFFLWLSSLITVRDETAPLELEEMPSLAAVESQTTGGGMEINAGAVGAAVVILLLIGIGAALFLLRKKRVAPGTLGAVSASAHTVRRSGGTARAIWRRIMENLLFVWTAFVNRDTPGGLFVTLERRGRRLRKPRKTGETMRQFIARMDPDGGLGILADALDRQYYGGENNTLSRQQCRALRQIIRKAG